MASCCVPLKRTRIGYSVMLRFTILLLTLPATALVGDSFPTPGPSDPIPLAQTPKVPPRRSKRPKSFTDASTQGEQTREPLAPAPKDYCQLVAESCTCNPSQCRACTGHHYE